MSSKQESTADLTEELRAWCSARGLPFKSASDLRGMRDLTDTQFDFIVSFIDRWELAEDRERGRADSNSDSES